ncbi:MAG: response regulator [Ardenticatenales bacterium]|nr:response regulator [Ardenticatenales bacterium]
MNRVAKILVVEDNLDMLDGIVDYLEVNRALEYSVEIHRAMNGFQALALMETVTPDIIISDIMMPEMDGFVFYARVRKETRWTRIPFVFLTARGDETDIRIGQEMGADLYITKPFDGRELVELINTQLRKSFHRQDLNQRKISKAKSQMMQVINHEFRTPLTYVIAYAEILQASMQQSDPRGLFEYLNGIQNGCVRLGSIVDDLLTIIKIRSGAMAQYVAERTEIIQRPDELLADAIAECRPLADSAGVQVVVAETTFLPPISGDRATLQDALVRLIDNAIKFTEIAILLRNLPEEKRIVEIEARATDAEITFAIVDHGVGFPSSMRYEIFRFFNQYNRDFWEQQGCGAGLSIAEAILQEHNGYISACSEKDVQTKFEMHLPTAAAREQGNYPVEPKREVTVLLVEDDYNLLVGLNDMLEIHDGRYHYVPLMALNGLEALKVLEEHTPDIIVSDIMMPHMNGYEFLETVRKKPEWTQIPVIFLTAMGEKVDIFKARKMGVEEYVTKPYNTENLLKLIDIQLERHFTRQNALHEDIEVLRNLFLELLQQDLRPSLRAVNTHSEAMTRVLKAQDPEMENLMGAKDESSLKLSLQNIQNHSGRLHRVVEDLIKLTELKANKALAENLTPMGAVSNLGSYIRGEVDAYNLEHSRIGVRITADFPRSLPKVNGDEILLGEIFRRLLELTMGLVIDRDGNEISFLAKENGTFLDVHIQFNGRGMLPKEWVAFNEMIENQSEAIKKEYLFGPNLLIVNEHVQRHGGRLAYTSLADDQHQITVSIPLFSHVEPSVLNGLQA